jgi:hypothetical protein
MSFQQTLLDIKNNMSYDVNRKYPKQFAKLKSIERFNHRTGVDNSRCINNCTWSERVILEVGTIDLDSNRCEVTNPITKASAIIDISKLTFCNADGSKR